MSATASLRPDDERRTTRKDATTHPLHDPHLQHHPSRSQPLLHLLHRLSFRLLLLLVLKLLVCCSEDESHRSVEEAEGGDVGERDDDLVMGVVEEEADGGWGSEAESKLDVNKVANKRRR